MKYCKSCGKENSKKICVHCGKNAIKSTNYCGWCGNAIDNEVIICPNCNEKQIVGAFSKICSIIGVVIAVIWLFASAGCIVTGEVIPAVLFILDAILLLPFAKNIIRKITIGNKSKRILLSIVRGILIFALFAGATITMSEAEPVGNEVTKEAATEVALEVFHKEVKLKNEESFVLNGSDVRYKDSYNGNDNLALVTVVLDYSAQNGFGGMNRENYTVQLIFNYAHGTYRELD